MKPFQSLRMARFSTAGCACRYPFSCTFDAVAGKLRLHIRILFDFAKLCRPASPEGLKVQVSKPNFRQYRLNTPAADIGIAERSRAVLGWK